MVRKITVLDEEDDEEDDDEEKRNGRNDDLTVRKYDLDLNDDAIKVKIIIKAVSKIKIWD